MTRLVPFNSNYPYLDKTMKDFHDLVDDFFNQNTRPSLKEMFKLDVSQKDHCYLIEAELPGIRKEDISLELHEGRLTISVQKNETSEKEEKNYIHKERKSTSMSRVVYLGDVDDEKVQASMDNGILSISVPTKEPVETKKSIAIE